MKTHLLIIAVFLFLFSCKKEDSITCTTCNSPQTTSFEVCKDGNGNATVNGENTDANYELYIDNLIAVGSTCGN